jgi:predicted O-methyltransferase YrrM
MSLVQSAPMRAHEAGAPAHDIIRTACEEASLAVDRLSTGVDDSAYRRLTELGLNENQIKLIERFPSSEASFVDAALATLREHDLIATTSYSSDAFEAYRERVASCFEHAGRVTYIFPEEARLLYALAEITRPRRVAFLGSYYGYWAIWALPAIAAAGGRATLVDVNSDHVALARHNIERLGFGANAEVTARDAISYMHESAELFDWIVLDAEGPKRGLPYDETDKALYYPMARAALGRLRPGGILACHNVLLEHPNDDPYFANVIRNNERQFYRFLPLIEENCPRRVDLPSTEGVGIYAVAPTSCSPEEPIALKETPQ